MSMKLTERGLFLSLFNRGGHVLDFTIDDFNAFTMQSVGVALCQRYGMSKGKSLTRFVYEADEEQVTKLLSDLFDYYEAHYGREIDTEEDGWGNPNEYRDYYVKCKSIIEREHSGIAVQIQRSNLEQHFTSEYMRSQIDMLFKTREANPTEAIGKSKELIESCCKTILEENGESYEKGWTVSELVKATTKCLDITADSINEDQPAGDTIKKILHSLAAIAGGIAELRNPYGSGHGKSDSYQGLSARHAKLAVGSSVTLVEYLWDAHQWRQEKRTRE
ncbi:MAG: abortive infection family protein [Atopobiaceae bacterium]|jgi:hypothetical protein|nr:abortive infection family protein [Atopobiaceae bacterium]